jgi:hypothetical protein
MPIKSSSFSPVYNTNTNGDLVVEVLNSSSGSGALPPNAATATNQTTTNNLLSPIGMDVNNLKSNVASILPFLGLDVTAIRALLPASLGTKTAANSLAVTLASDSSIINQIGEVTANPTANTLLARLKTLGDALSSPQNLVVTGINVSTTSVVLSIVDATRRLVIIHNYSSQSLAIRLGFGDASFAKNGFNTIIPANGMLTFDRTSGASLQVSGIWAGSDATGYANVTTFT